MPEHEGACPSCGRGVVRFPYLPIPDGSVGFCEPADPWNPRGECLARFLYDGEEKEWHRWPVPSVNP